MWERQIRTVRQLLGGITQEQKLSKDQLETLFCEVEAIVNSRPLTPLSDDPNDFEPLTPAHLLTWKSTADAPAGPFRPRECLALRRWKQVQHLANVFWARFRKEYFFAPATAKVDVPSKNLLEVGDLVLMVNNNAKRCQWPLARVIKTYDIAVLKIQLEPWSS